MALARHAAPHDLAGRGQPVPPITRGGSARRSPCGRPGKIERRGGGGGWAGRRWLGRAPPARPPPRLGMPPAAQAGLRAPRAVGRLDDHLIPVGDAELRRRLGADDQRVVWLERHQQLVVLRARVRVARLLPVDEVERELGVRHPLAWPVLGGRVDRLAVDVLLLGELGVEELDLAGAGEEATPRGAAADRIADLPGLLALELGTVEDPVTVGEEGPAGDDPADLHASLRLGSGPPVAGDDDRLLLALGVI